MAGELKGKVVVITGASSGIGRATALRFAGKGAKVVLAARGFDALDDAARLCRSLGAEAIAVPADVSDESRVRKLAAAAVERFGAIDVWVNAAAVVSFGKFEDVPSEAFRRVVEANVFGVVHGSRAALARFEKQGRGVLINVASVLGKEGIPYLSSYVASKEAVIGFSSCLREELQGKKDIHVCTIQPASIDTPIWRHGANYSGKKVRPVRPVYEPEQVADAIVACALKPKRIVNVGLAGPVVTAFHKVLPSIYEIFAGRAAKRMLFEEKSAEDTEGNLFGPSRGPMSEHGGWESHGKAVDRLGVALAAGVLLLIAGAVFSRKRRS